uniref:Zgc:123107 n=1 Tax=Sphaeramia orbicularis TaxID=375764 RepID=A0A672ZTJ0_9TELE
MKQTRLKALYSKNNHAPSAVLIYPKEDVLLDVQNTLVCHVSGFYPAPVQVQWTHNERNVSGAATGNVPYPSKDGTFSQISRLEFTPKQGDIYSCTVQHPALSTPLTRIWGKDQETLTTD